MFGRAVDVVSRNAVNPDFLPDEDKSTRSSIFWLVSNESYRCGSTKSAPIWLFAMVILHAELHGGP
ncbi:hypothetical protein [Klebsiella pneumoniae]|uniref:hypothetical protein n=1 Tax=Klebsiella pneumoniae TaxID=573 RepID=UPI003CE9CBD2